MASVLYLHPEFSDVCATVDAALRARFQAVCFALESCETPDEAEPLLARIFADVFDGAIAGDSRLLHMLLGKLMV